MVGDQAAKIAVERVSKMPELFYRKLWDAAMLARWNGCLLTSQHPHGEPAEWSSPRQNGVMNVNQYPLVTDHGHGLALPCARDKYFAMCVQSGIAWGALAPADVFDILEQAGVFAYRDPVDAYWYSGSQPVDMFVSFYGVELSPGPEPRSVITPVIKKISVMTRQQFLVTYFGGNAPAQPVNDMVVDYDPTPGELFGGDEGYDDMPDLRAKK
jgi:hypothetical protein